MKLSTVEKSILDHLAAKGAATRLELAAATGFSKSGIRNAIRTLVAGKRVKQHVLKREEGYSHRHRTFIAAIEAPEPTPEHAPESPTLNIFEHANLYNRLTELEQQYTRLNKTHKDLRADFDDKVAGITNELAERNTLIQKVRTALKILGKRTADLDLDRIRIDGVLIEQGERIRALEPQPEVDPLYTEIEREITETLGGKYSPELLRALIDSAYAEKAK
jgi:DNA-binding Lrp family transcriptional regulator